VSFSVAKGSTYGVIGRNGSGKSTALKSGGGHHEADQRNGEVDGRISALIELGAGFHPEISGRENVFINGIMLGLSKSQIQERFDEIVDFAELREFIDAPCEDILVRHVHASRLRRGHSRGSGRAARG
jgi:ABC-type polysaccharide/polyol phosphate transport system ATPase subunit